MVVLVNDWIPAKACTKIIGRSRGSRGGRAGSGSADGLDHDLAHDRGADLDARKRGHTSLRRSMWLAVGVRHRCEEDCLGWW
jgi:hypothetical protein